MDPEKPELISLPTHSVDADLSISGSAYWQIRHIRLRTFAKLWKNHNAVGMLRNIGYCFVPQPVRTRYWDDHIEPAKLSATSWMDGLRGVAAFTVFNFHYFFAFTDATIVGYGWDEKHKHLMALPPLRLFWDGGTAVNVFFVIAGYVCSIRALGLMTSNHTDKALRNLAASVFRRFFRLYLPVMCATFSIAILAYVGIFEATRPIIKERKLYFPGPWSEINLRQCGSLKEQVYFWCDELFKLMNVWNIGAYYPEHEPHLWTIPFEFRMSMHLYIALVGLAPCRPIIRLFILGILGIMYIRWNRWEGPLFFMGAVIAQFDVLRSKKGVDDGLERPLNTSRSPSYRFPLRSRHMHHVYRPLLYLFALYLMSYPTAGPKRPSPGYVWVNKLIPEWYSRKDKLPKTFGVIILVSLLTTDPNPIASPRPSLWHRALTHKIPQYLGKIMFGFYLVHGTLLHAFGYAIPHVIWMIIGNGNVFCYMVGLMTGWTISLAISICLADVFTREVDARCAKAIKYLERWCFTS